jgi:hypothetical protein
MYLYILKTDIDEEASPKCCSTTPEGNAVPDMGIVALPEIKKQKIKGSAA